MYILNTENCKEIENFEKDTVEHADNVSEILADAAAVAKKKSGKKKLFKDLFEKSLNKEEKCLDNECFANIKNIELLTETDGTSSDGEKENEDLIQNLGAPLNEVTTVSGISNNNDVDVNTNVEVDSDVEVAAVSSSELTGSDLDNDTLTEKEEINDSDVEEIDEEDDSFLEKNKFYIILLLVILLVTFLMAK